MISLIQTIGLLALNVRESMKYYILRGTEKRMALFGARNMLTTENKRPIRLGPTMEDMCREIWHKEH